MTTASSSDVLELEMRIAARPETVYALLSSGEEMARWFGSKVELDPKPGGKIRVDINGRDIVSGEMVELAPNERVVFTFGWEEGGQPLPPGSSTVEISLVKDGEETILRLSHRGLTAEQAASHKEGWEHFLPRLVALAEGRDPGPDPWTE